MEDFKKWWFVCLRLYTSFYRLVWFFLSTSQKQCAKVGCSIRFIKRTGLFVCIQYNIRCLCCDNNWCVCGCSVQYQMFVILIGVSVCVHSAISDGNDEEPASCEYWPLARWLVPVNILWFLHQPPAAGLPVQLPALYRRVCCADLRWVLLWWGKLVQLPALYRRVCVLIYGEYFCGGTN